LPARAWSRPTRDLSHLPRGGSWRSEEELQPTAARDQAAPRDGPNIEVGKEAAPAGSAEVEVVLARRRGVRPAGRSKPWSSASLEAWSGFTGSARIDRQSTTPRPRPNAAPHRPEANQSRLEDATGRRNSRAAPELPRRPRAQGPFPRPSRSTSRKKRPLAPARSHAQAGGPSRAQRLAIHGRHTDSLARRFGGGIPLSARPSSSKKSPSAGMAARGANRWRAAGAAAPPQSRKLGRRYPRDQTSDRPGFAAAVGFAALVAIDNRAGSARPSVALPLRPRWAAPRPPRGRGEAAVSKRGRSNQTSDVLRPAGPASRLTKARRPLGPARPGPCERPPRRGSNLLHPGASSRFATGVEVSMKRSPTRGSEPRGCFGSSDGPTSLAPPREKARLFAGEALFSRRGRPRPGWWEAATLGLRAAARAACADRGSWVRCGSRPSSEGPHWCARPCKGPGARLVAGKEDSLGSLARTKRQGSRPALLQRPRARARRGSTTVLLELSNGGRSSWRLLEGRPPTFAGPKPSWVKPERPPLSGQKAGPGNRIVGGRLDLGPSAMARRRAEGRDEELAEKGLSPPSSSARPKTRATTRREGSPVDFDFRSESAWPRSPQGNRGAGGPRQNAQVERTAFRLRSFRRGELDGAQRNAAGGSKGGSCRSCRLFYPGSDGLPRGAMLAKVGAAPIA